MKNILILCFAITTIMACKEKDNTTENKSDWIVLFDGDDFNNWRGYLREDMYPEWTLEEGTMMFTPGEKGGKNIITKEKYTNFILSVEWRISEGGNSGIFWSVFEDEKFPEAYHTGPEIQVLDNAKHPDSFVAEGTHKAGSLYDMIACQDDVINPVGEWNLCVLEINHKVNLGKISMNGTEVMTFPVHGEAWDKMVANSKFNGWEGFGKYQTGHIGLQDHSDKVWYRNIKIKPL